MEGAAEQLDQALEEARKALLVGYDACRRALDGQALHQEEVVNAQRALAELEAVVAEIREILDADQDAGRRS